VIAPPKPSIVWKLRVGSITIVGALGCAVVNGTVPASVSLSVPFAVVIQTWALVDRPAAREFWTADEETIAAVNTSAETALSENSQIRRPQVGPEDRNDI
jgi:hypothetical protein